MAGGDDLIEEIRRLLVQGQIPKFVTDEQGGLGIRTFAKLFGELLGGRDSVIRNRLILNGAGLTASSCG